MPALRHSIAAALLAALVAGSAAAVTGPPAQRRVLPNGAVLVVSEQHAVPMVVVRLLLDAGSRRDSRGQEGLAALAADLLTEGTKTRSASQISEATDFIGADLDSSADTDYATLQLRVLRKDLGTGLALLTDILLHPSFPDAEIARRREAALATMRVDQDNPGRVAERTFLDTLFPAEPYGHPAIGTPEAVRRLTRAQIVSFYERYYHPEGSIITVVGDVSAAAITRRLQDALQGWGRGPETPFTYPAVSRRPRATVAVDKPITQANIILGERGVARNNPDYYALTVMNYILGGGGFASRLMTDIRSKAGLAYAVASFFTVNQFPGSFQVVMQTKNESANDAIRRACTDIERIRQQPVSDDELQAAKRYLTGSFPLRLDTDTKIAAFLAQVEFFHLGAGYADTYARRITAVTKDDVQRVARRYLSPEGLDLVVVANLAQAKVSGRTSCAAP